MTITAQDFIKGRLDSTDLPTCAIVAHPTQANRWRLIPVSPFDSAQLSTVSYLFDDVSPHDDGAEISVPAEYPAGTTAAEREWLTRPGTLERMLEQVLIDQQMIANVQSIGMGLGHPNNLVIKFSGPAPVVPSGAKKNDLAQAGLVEIKQGGSPGTWMLRVSDQWRIELQAGDRLRELQAKVNELTSRNDALKSELSAAQDRIAEKDARIEKYRAERDQFHSDVIALEAQLLDAVAIIPAQPAAQMMMYSTALSGDRETMIDLPELLGQGWHIAAEWIIGSDHEHTDKYYARLEKRPVSRLMVQPTERAARRPYMVNRNARMQADNAEVVQGIHAVKSSPRPVYRPLIGVQNG